MKKVHFVQHMPSRNAPKVVLVTDCMSAVAGFEGQAAGFIGEMKKQGVRTMTAGEAAAALKA